MAVKKPKSEPGRFPALRLAPPPPSDLRRARPGGRGNRLPAEIREVEGSRTSTPSHGPHDLPPLGNAPAGWPPDLRAIWRSVRDEVPWLRRSDRQLMIRYCRLLKAHEADYAAYEEAGVEGAGSPHWKAFIETGRELLRLEQRCGMTPADRSRIVGGF